MEFRDLKFDEIECRVASCKENGLSLLLYKNARCDMNLLDECIGAENWQRDHKELKSNIYCGISIWDKNKGIWVTKWDCGSESFSDKEKGEASDSFKRAGFNWGIGRELYTAPFIWIKSENCKIYDTGRLDKYNKPIYGCNDNFEVKSIEIKDKKIISLEITLKNKVVFSTKALNTTEPKTEIEEIVDKVVTDKEVQNIRMLLNAGTIEKTNENIKFMLKKYNKEKLEDLMMTEYAKMVHEIQKMKENQKKKIGGIL